MLPIRFWLLASVALSIAGCQFPLFRDRVSSILQRENPDQVQREGGPRHGDNRVPEVSAELPVETSRQPQIEQLLSRGNQELAQGRLADAQICFRQALDIAPKNCHAHHMLARIGDQTQQYEEAEGHYLAALSSNPADPNLLSDVGYSYLLQGKYAYAESYLKRALEYAPGHVMARRNFAALAAYQGDYPKALGWLRQFGTEQQAQTTLREIIANRPPQLSLGNDPLSEFPPDASPAAQGQAAHLWKAREQAACEEWKCEMAEWNREQAQRARVATKPVFDPRHPVRMYPGSPNESQHEALRTVDEDYQLRARQPNQRQPVVQQGQPAWGNAGPQVMQLAEQMRYEDAARNQQGPLFPQGQQPMVATHQGQMQYQHPTQGQPQYRPATNLNPNQMPYFDYQGQLIQRGVHTGSQIPSQGESRSDLNRDAKSQVELNPAPADFGQRPRDQQLARPTFQGQSQGPRVWNPQSLGAQSPEDAVGIRRALDLGMSIGPGSLFPLEVGGTEQASVSRSQRGGNRPESNQSPLGRLPATGAAAIQPLAGQPAHPGQQLSYDVQAQQPNIVHSGLPDYSPTGPAAPAHPYFGEGSAGVVHMSSQEEDFRFSANRQRQQNPSSNRNNEPSQPFRAEHSRTQPVPLQASVRAGGALASPTMSSDFVRSHYMTREQQQIPHTSHTTPAGTTGSTESMRSGTAETGSPIGVQGTLPDFSSADGSGINQLRVLHNSQF